MMKKIAISGLFILVFIAYVIYQKDLPKEARTVSSNSEKIINTQGKYKDGEYTTRVGDAYFGPLQFKLVIEKGNISDIVFLKYPNDRPTSIQINEDAMPILKQEAIQAQSSDVDIVTGATQTAEAFQLLLKEELAKAAV